MKQREFHLKNFDHHIMTGFHFGSKRKFRHAFTSYFHVVGINLWRDRVWGVKPDGKRTLLERVWN